MEKETDALSEPCATSNSEPPSPMSITAVNVLDVLLKYDGIMRDNVHNCAWQLAAARWNSFVTKLRDNSGLKKNIREELKIVSSALLQQGMKIIDKRRDKLLEQEAIDMKAKYDKIPWKGLSAIERHFTSYELTTLLAMVNRLRLLQSITHKNVNQRKVRQPKLFIMPHPHPHLFLC